MRIRFKFRFIIKYKNNTEKALARGDRRFTRNAISSLIGSIEAIRPSNKNKGLPGGWGTPKVYETAINSPQSQYETLGAIVSKYTMKDIRNVIAPKMRFILMYFGCIILFFDAFVHYF